MSNVKIWKTFEGKRKVNGQIPKFWIQDITPDLKADVLNFFEKYYHCESPLQKYIGEQQQLLT